METGIEVARRMLDGWSEEQDGERVTFRSPEPEPPGEFVTLVVGPRKEPERMRSECEYALRRFREGSG